MAARSRKKPEFPARVLKLASACSGGRLVKVFRVRPGQDTEEIYIIEPSGRRAPSTSARDAIRLGALVPTGDGLFDGCSQSFVARPGL